MDSFEKLLAENRYAVERFVKFRVSSTADAEDILQETYLAAYQKFGQLKNQASFKPWIVSIARNKCNDFYRRKAACLEIPLDDITVKELSGSRYGLAEVDTVDEILHMLRDKDREILYLYYWMEQTQHEIAKKLNIPLGTVKSRLCTARRNFKNHYPYSPDIWKGEYAMERLPGLLPEYEIEESKKAPFKVRWEELMGWFLVPRLGEKLSWGMYDIPSRKCSRRYDMRVTGRAVVHGIDGVEITAREKDCSGTGKQDVMERAFVAQLTDTHCRYLAAMWNDGDVRKYSTFLDGEGFLPSWGFGEGNCGKEINLLPKGEIRRDGAVVTCYGYGGNNPSACGGDESSGKEPVLDVVGRYTVAINGKGFDCICVMDIEGGVVSEQFLDKNGKTILWRRFNRDDWAIGRYRKRWRELLPENEQIVVNGDVYVHWYDCVTDYIFSLL